MSAPPRILFIPGKSPKPKPWDHHQQLWRCLLHGVQQTNPDIAQHISEREDCFSLIPWNAFYYHETRSIEDLLPWIDKLCLQNGPTEADKEEARSWNRKKAKLFMAMGDRFPWFIPFIPDPAIKASIQEMSRYFANKNNIACKIRKLLKKEIRKSFKHNERVLLICHSLGAVIAFDSLWELWFEQNIRQRVDLFLTIGSPLGMRFFQKRMVNAKQPPEKRYPGNIRRWKNISSEGDLVSLDTTVNNDYGMMIESGLTESIEDQCHDVFNYFHDEKGLNVHQAYGYLVNPAVSKAIASWWREFEKSSKNNN